MPRATDAQDGRPLLEDGRTLGVAAIVWATGFRNDYRWIDLPVLDPQGRPVHRRGAAAGAPGLYFLGLPFQYALSSSLLGGVGEDAAWIAAHMRQAAAPVRGASGSAVR